jgi:hypothetical protein
MNLTSAGEGSFTAETNLYLTANSGEGAFTAETDLFFTANSGEGGFTVETDLNLTANSGDLNLSAGGAATPLNEAGDLSLDAGLTAISVIGAINEVFNMAPNLHASSHEDGGTDELDLTGMSGLLATAQTPTTHASSHQNGGADEISVAGLSGLLADAQTALQHALDSTTRHSALSDNTNFNASASAHGFLPKLPNDALLFLNGTGAYTNPRQLVGVNNQTGTSYTLALADAQKLVRCSNAGAINLTVPPNSTVAFPLYSQIAVEQYGAGQVTIVAGGGVTINRTEKKITGQYKGAALVKIATDEWSLFGDLEA